MIRVRRLLAWLFEPTVSEARVHLGGRFGVCVQGGAVWLAIGDDAGRCLTCVRMTVEDANRLSASLYRAGVAAAMRDVNPAAGLAAANEVIRS